MERSLKDQAIQLERDLTSPYATTLRSLLRQAIVENDKLLSSIDTRLFQAIDNVSRPAGAIVIGVNVNILEQSRTSLIIQELTDNLILHYDPWPRSVGDLGAKVVPEREQPGPRERTGTERVTRGGG